MISNEEYLKQTIDFHLSTDGLFNGKRYLHCFEGIGRIDNVEAVAYLCFEYSCHDDASRQRYLTCKLYVEIDDLAESQISKQIIGTDRQYLNYDLETCDFILKSVKEMLTNVKFDKFKSRFTYQDIINTRLVDFIAEGNPNITKSYHECCVCFDNIIKKTTCCKSYLCVPCNMSIAEVPCGKCLINFNEDCEDINCMKRPCPHCRHKLKLYDGDYIYN